MIFSLFSCKTVTLKMFGNTLTDKMYNPEKPKELFYTEIPYTIEDGFITLKVGFNNSDKKYNLIFDTGSNSYVSEMFLKELEIKELTNHNGGKDVHNQDINGDTFKTNINLNGLIVKNIRFISIKSVIFEDSCGVKLDGILGKNVLNLGLFYFDANRKILIITNQIDKLPNTAFNNPITLKRYVGQLYFNTKIENKKIKLKLDTGYSDGLILINKNTFSLNNSNKIKYKNILVSGLSSTFISEQQHFEKKVKIGINNYNMPITTTDMNVNVIGNQIIQNNNVLIDVNNKKMYINAIESLNYKKEVNNIDFSYLGDKFIISGLSNNPNIINKGIQIKDTLIILNNKSLNEFENYCEAKEYIKTQLKKEKFPLLLEIKSKDSIKKITITASDYFD